MSNVNGTVVPAQKKPTLLQTIGGEQFKQQLAMALPRHLPPDRFARIAITAMRKTPKLLQCTPESVFNCLLQLSQYGLEPDGRRAHLIPYGTECTLILDYKGIAELALRSGLVSTLHADVVHRGDVFEYSLGNITKHTPWFLRCDKDKPEKEGDVFAVYAICQNKDGTTASAVLSYDDVEAVRKRSRAGNNGPWKTDWNEMAKKTAFRRLSKWLVLSPEFREAVAADEDTEIVETASPQPLKISDLIGDIQDGDSSNQSIDQDLTSHFEPCCTALKAIGCEVVDTNPEETIVTYNLPNGGVVKIGDGATGDNSIDTLEPDAREQVQNQIDRALKKR